MRGDDTVLAVKGQVDPPVTKIIDSHTQIRKDREGKSGSRMHFSGMHTPAAPCINVILSYAAKLIHIAKIFQ